MVIDNVESGIDLARVLRPLVAAGAMVLLTAREGDMSGALGMPPSELGEHIPEDLRPLTTILPLGFLSADEAADLFTKESGPGNIQDWTPAQRTALDRIITRLGGLTLAVKLAASYSKDTGTDVAKLADELDDPQRVTKLDGIESIYLKSRDALSTEARRLFWLFGAFRTSEFGAMAAAAMAATFGDADPSATIDLLARRGLASKRHSASLASPTDARAEERQVEPLQRAHAAVDEMRIELHPVLFDLARNELDAAPPDDQYKAHATLASFYGAYVTSVERDALALDERNVEGALEWAQQARQLYPVARICVGMQAYWRDYGRNAARQRYLPWGLRPPSNWSAIKPPPTPKNCSRCLGSAMPSSCASRGK